MTNQPTGRVGWPQPSWGAILYVFFVRVPAGGTAVFIDAEHALDSAYAKAIGVDMTKLYLAQPDNGEQGWHKRERYLRREGTTR